MITYIDSENKQDYTILFNKASARLGLSPIDKEVGLNPDGSPIIQRFKRVQINDVWTEVPCVEFDKADGADNSNADFNADGDFLINKVVGWDEEQGTNIVEKVVSHGITNLNEYFQHIEELAALATNQGRTGTDPYFLRVPLDEPFFEINANTRGITVPGELSQVGVVGDKLAEILFFRIDRYYDAVDLNTRHIYIEWELPDGTRGISRDFLRDTQSEKDKIIFGWLIDDKLTEQVGTIRFAVRFVEWSSRGDSSNAPTEGTGLQYSFSSLPATISISNTLHYTLFEDDEELKYDTAMSERAISNLTYYLENSDPDSTDEVAPQLAAMPIFVRNLDANADVVTANVMYKRNLNGGRKGEQKGSLKLVTEAYAKDAGNIAYKYGYRAQLTDGVSGLQTDPEFIKVADTSNTSITYYIQLDNMAFQPVSQDEIATIMENLEEGQTADFYEKTAVTTIDKPGYYHVNARNRVSGLKTNTADSYILYVPYAAMPEVTQKMEYIDSETGESKPQRFVINQINYSTEKDASIDQTKVADEDKSNISIIMSEAGPATITLAPTVRADDGTGTENFSYQWYKSDDIYDVAMENAVAIEGANAATYEAATPGCYALKIDNQFNNDHTETELLDAGVCRVTNMPVIPNLTTMWKRFEEILTAGRENQPVLEIPEVDHDVMHFEWHKITADNADEDPLATGDLAVVEGDLTFTNGIATIPFIPQSEGYYYFLLKNTLNGATAIMNSATSYGVIRVRRA